MVEIVRSAVAACLNKQKGQHHYLIFKNPAPSFGKSLTHPLPTFGIPCGSQGHMAATASRKEGVYLELHLKTISSGGPKRFIEEASATRHFNFFSR